jgi:3-(3-hydroxy-phenyl)propionate hydroxylase
MAQGMCQGIRDAANLAWKVELVLAGKAGEALLDSYQAERRPHVRATTETAKGLGRIICELDPEKAQVRDAHMLAENGSPPTVRYRQSLIPGLAEGALWHEQGAPVGARFPQPWIRTEGGTCLLDDFAGAGFRLVLSSGSAKADVPPELQSTLARLGCVVVALQTSGISRRSGPNTFAVVEKDNLLKDWFQANSAMAALIRPDHYVFAAVRQWADVTGLCACIRTRVLCDATA